MGFAVELDHPYYQGTSQATAEIPGRFDVALAGRPYMLDLEANLFRHESVPLLRTQADSAQSPSEVSINPEDLWRRSADTWHEGAGQSHFDRPDSSPARFNTSKGIDVWEKWQISLLNAVTEGRTSVNTNLKAIAVGLDHLYFLDGTEVRFTTNLFGATTNVVLEDAVPDPRDITSNGFEVFIAVDDAGIEVTTRGSATAEQGVTGTVKGPIAYVKNRLMVADDNEIFNVTDIDTVTPPALPVALFIHDNTDFRWVGFAEGTGHIYAAGFSGDKSEIYRTAVQADGTALDVPVVAGELPDGEIVRAIQGYLGFIVVGTDLGVRFAAPDANGDLVLGALIETTSAVEAFEPQDRFVWYGLTNFDGSSTGLGRLDLSIFTAPLTPAFASDIMAGTAAAIEQGVVSSIATTQERRVFSVDGNGFFVEDVANLVSTGFIDSGRIDYKLSDNKVAVFHDIVHDHNGDFTSSLSIDGGAFTPIGTHLEHAGTVSDVVTFDVEERGNDFELRLTFNVNTLGPVIRASTLRAYPATPTVNMIFAPVLIHDTVRDHAGTPQQMDVNFEINAIKALRTQRDLVTWQEGVESFRVIVQDYDWRPHHASRDRRGWNGTCLIAMKEI